MYTLFNPLCSDYKSVRGSITAGTCLRFRLLLPRNLNAHACRIVLLHDNAPEEKLGLYWESTDGVTEWWGTDITPDNVGIIFYHFEFDTPWGTSAVTKGKDFDGIIGSGAEWQLTVYSPEFSTPDWIKGGIIYQIFPDRYCNSGSEKKGVPNDRVIRKDWGAVPVWEKDEHGEIVNNDYFCGDFKGIEEKLPYIASLGVNCIYLNPIAEAHSNHRYDVADYMKPDPLLGTEDDFVSLCSKARELNIRVITDGVYSHTGSDSIYFNKNNRYAVKGAFNDRSSPYYSWYKFDKREKYGYKCWWNVPTLPEVNEDELSFTQLITGDNGVIEHWLKLGASGLRLDVADELPDTFLDNIRIRLKSVDSEAFLLGEVWEDASNKISYGARRRYLIGSQLDSVMNYPFRDAIIDFMLYASAESFAQAVLTICENYPAPALNCLMNHLGTHDTERILTVLAGINCGSMNRSTQAGIKLSSEQMIRGTQLLKMAYTLIYTLPGVPSIYYGDELPLEGCRDPFNRGCFDWSRTDSEFTDFVKLLGKIRNDADCLSFGCLDIISATMGCVAYIRKNDSSSLLVIANKNRHSITYYLNDELASFYPILAGIRTENGVIIDSETCAVLINK